MAVELQKMENSPRSLSCKINYSQKIDSLENSTTEDDSGDRKSSAGGGNRWPREETLALLKVRSDMDLIFKDFTSKAPLWDEVSRKLVELGFHRNAKKCKEKFESIYKCNRRTKKGRSNHKNCKSYCLFEQIEAFTPINPSSPNMVVTPSLMGTNDFQQEIITSMNSITSSSSEESEGLLSRKKKRTMSRFFEGLVMQVIEKQEILQKNLIESMERYETERIAREEEWKLQEGNRIKREHDLLIQERSIVAAKDAAVMAFLQKFSEQSGAEFHFSETFDQKISDEKQENCSNIHTKRESRKQIRARNSASLGSRWPKEEVEALIKIKTTFLDEQNPEIIHGSKGPLWEEISFTMKKNGYDRSALRCKEKWENINKYFKRMKESNKRRPENSKTCPYFHQLEALHQVRSSIPNVTDSSDTCDGYNFKPEDLLMQMLSQGRNEQLQEINHQTHIGREDGDDDDTSSVAMMS